MNERVRVGVLTAGSVVIGQLQVAFRIKCTKYIEYKKFLEKYFVEPKSFADVMQPLCLNLGAFRLLL